MILYPNCRSADRQRVSDLVSDEIHRAGSAPQHSPFLADGNNETRRAQGYKYVRCQLHHGPHIINPTVQYIDQTRFKHSFKQITMKYSVVFLSACLAATTLALPEPAANPIPLTSNVEGLALRDTSVEAAKDKSVVRKATKPADINNYTDTKGVSDVDDSDFASIINVPPGCNRH